jgi:uncharacterized protein YceH (UPF0502 family)
MNQIQSSETVLCEQDTQQIMRCQAGAEHLLGELTRLCAARNALLAELALREISVVGELRSRLDRLAALGRSGA